MSTYHQMGHDSQNLLAEEHLDQFDGAILSPVNENEDSIRAIISHYNSQAFEMIFDPQMYYPESDRGNLPNWPYFPSDVDTADKSSADWWIGVLKDLKETIVSIGPNSVCSPAVVPRTFSDEYYELNMRIGDDLRDLLGNEKIDVLYTLIVDLDDLYSENKAAEIASIATNSGARRVFLVMKSNTIPRRELNNTESLIGIMRLIKYLEKNDIRILVGFSSSDIILWKTAGASSCASGKFFNLRRFTPSRFTEPPEGGGQVSYWFEESLFAFIRQADLIRIRNENLISQTSLNNPYAVDILEQIDSNPEVAWLALSWRQFLYWFAEFEERISKSGFDPDQFLAAAEVVWNHLDNRRILMDERQNDGNWLRSWRQAIIEFDRGL